MRPSTALTMGRHLTVLLVTIPLSFSPLGEERPTAETTPEVMLKNAPYGMRDSPG
jgi:hypothetical protein